MQDTKKPEVWKKIKNWPYEISSHGNVRSLDRVVGKNRRWFLPGKMMAKTIHTTGYYTTVLSKDGHRKRFYVHRLVAKYFAPNPNRKPVVNHLDGVKTNPYFENLQWVTKLENEAHATEMGLMAKGERHGSCKIKRQDVIRIRSMRNSGALLKEIHELYPMLSRRYIREIYKKRAWKHVK